MREDPTTKKALQTLVRHPRLALKAIAAELGVPYDTVHSWVAPDGPVPTLRQVRQLVAAARRLDEPAARQLAEELFGLEVAGWLLAVAPAHPGRPAELAREVLEAGAAVGRVSAWVVEATADGVVGPSEAEEGASLLRHVQREAAEASAALRAFMVPQLALAGVA
jgi:hypothetical protein